MELAKKAILSPSFTEKFGLSNPLNVEAAFDKIYSTWKLITAIPFDIVDQTKTGVVTRYDFEDVDAFCRTYPILYCKNVFDTVSLTTTATSSPSSQITTFVTGNNIAPNIYFNGVASGTQTWNNESNSQLAFSVDTDMFKTYNQYSYNVLGVYSTSSSETFSFRTNNTPTYLYLCYITTLSSSAKITLKGTSYLYGTSFAQIAVGGGIA